MKKFIVDIQAEDTVGFDFVAEVRFSRENLELIKTKLQELKASGMDNVTVAGINIDIPEGQEQLEFDPSENFDYPHLVLDKYGAMTVQGYTFDPLVRSEEIYINDLQTSFDNDNMPDFFDTYELDETVVSENTEQAGEFETYDEDLKHVLKVHQETPRRVWTRTSDDEGSTWIVNGYRLVNRECFFITTEEGKEGEEFLDFDIHDMD